MFSNALSICCDVGVTTTGSIKLPLPAAGIFSVINAVGDACL
jgi:hypothetical protein